MIVVFIHSGIGNQFFQYAFAKELAIKYGDQIYISMYNMKKCKDREYVLDYYKAGKNIKKLGNAGSVFFKILYYIRKQKINLMNKYTTSSREYILGKNGVFNLQSPYDYVQYPLTTKKIKYVFSNYQNMKYWIKDAQNILGDFNLVQRIKYNNPGISITENHVCVHVRRGDYVQNERWKEELLVCDNMYYNKAMCAIAKQLKNPVFCIFSNSHDDLVEIKKEMNFTFDVQFVESKNPDYAELVFMSKFKNFILSNSTYGWWAQRLSSGEGITVIPSIWNRTWEASGFYDPQLYSKRLIVIDVNKEKS